MPDQPDDSDSLARDLEPEVDASASVHAAHDPASCGIAAITRPVPQKQAQRGPAIDPKTISLDRDDAILFVIDVQERLCTAMEPLALASMIKNITVLLKAAARLGMPIICSEQYPKGLGHTVSSLKEFIPTVPYEKLEFSAGNNEAIARAVLDTGRSQVILVGMESHVCVFQTARDLVGAGFPAFVVEDAIISRSMNNCNLGLRLCEKAGATRTGTEAVLFDLLVQAGTPEFKELTRLIR